MINLNLLVKDLPSARQLNLEKLAEQLTPNAEARSFFSAATLPARGFASQVGQFGKGVYDIGSQLSQGKGIMDALASTDINKYANVTGLLNEQETGVAQSDPFGFGARAAIGNLGYAAGMGGVKIPFTPNAPRALTALAQSKALAPLANMPTSLKGNVAQGVFEGVTGGIGSNVDPNNLINDMLMGGVMGGTFRGLASGGPGNVNALRSGVGPITKADKNRMLVEGIAKLKAEGREMEIPAFAKQLNEQFSQAQRPQTANFADMTKKELRYTGEREPLLNTLRDIQVKTIDGQTRKIPAQEALDVYKLDNGQYYVQDGVKMVVPKGQMENIKSNSLVQREGKPWMENTDNLVVETLGGNTQKYIPGERYVIDDVIYKAEESDLQGKIKLVGENGVVKEIDNELPLKSLKYNMYKMNRKNPPVMKQEDYVGLRKIFNDSDLKGIEGKLRVRDSYGNLMSDRQIAELMENKAYKSGHYPELPNMILSERGELVDVTNRKINQKRPFKGWFSAETQSDVNQSIREYKKGKFRDENIKVVKNTGSDRVFNDINKDKYIAYIDNARQARRAIGSTPEEAIANLKINNVSNPVLEAIDKIKPDYQDLAARLGLKRAVENKAERFGWATGRQTKLAWHQNEVDDIRKIDWIIDKNGRYDIKTSSKNVMGRMPDERSYMDLTEKELGTIAGLKKSTIDKIKRDVAKKAELDDSYLTVRRVNNQGEVRDTGAYKKGTIEGRKLGNVNPWYTQAYDVSKPKAVEEALKELGVKPTKTNWGYQIDPDLGMQEDKPLFFVKNKIVNGAFDLEKPELGKRATIKDVKAGDILKLGDKTGYLRSSGYYIVKNVNREMKRADVYSWTDVRDITEYWHLNQPSKLVMDEKGWQKYLNQLKNDKKWISSFSEDEIMDRGADLYGKVKDMSDYELKEVGKHLIKELDDGRRDFFHEAEPFAINIGGSPNEKQWDIPITRQVEDLIMGRAPSMRKTSGSPLPRTWGEMMETERPNPNVFDNSPSYKKDLDEMFEKSKIEAIEERKKLRKTAFYQKKYTDKRSKIADAVHKIQFEDGVYDGETLVNGRVDSLEKFLKLKPEVQKKLLNKSGLEAKYHKDFKRYALNNEFFSQRLMDEGLIINAGTVENWRNMTYGEKRIALKNAVHKDIPEYLKYDKPGIYDWYQFRDKIRENKLPSKSAIDKYNEVYDGPDGKEFVKMLNDITPQEIEKFKGLVNNTTELNFYLEEAGLSSQSASKVVDGLMLDSYSELAWQRLVNWYNYLKSL